MREDLNSRIGAIAHARHTEFRTNVVDTSGSSISSECNLSEVPSLLRVVLDKCSHVKVCLRNRDVEDARTRGDVDCDGLIDAHFGSC